MNTDTEHPNALNILPDKGLVPIRTVASLTGVNPVTLRAWERRYGLIRPIRTPKGHRLYTMADVDLINRVVALLNSGMSIAQVSEVLEQPHRAGKGDEEEEAFAFWSAYQHRLIQAIVRFDDRTLDSIYNEALSLYPVDIVTSRLIVPLLQELGLRWERGEGSIAEEHFFSVFLRNKLGARFHHRSRELKGPKLLAACLPGEQHEAGILLFALSAMDRDFCVVLLGANVPFGELLPVVEHTGCRAIVLSGYLDIPKEIIHRDIARLVEQAKVPVFIGGRITERQSDELKAVGAIVLSTEFSLALRRIGAALV